MDVGNLIVILIYTLYLVIIVFTSSAKSLRLFEASDADVKAWLKVKDDLVFFDDSLDQSEWKDVVRIYKDQMIIMFIFLAFNTWLASIFVLDLDASKKYLIAYAIICSVLIYVKYRLMKGMEHKKAVGWVKNQYITRRKSGRRYNDVYNIELVYSQGGNQIQGITTAVHKDVYQCLKLNRRCKIIFSNDKVIDIQEL